MIYQKIFGVVIIMAFSLFQFFGFASLTEKDKQTASNTQTDNPRYKVAFLAGGCFWCVEADLERVKGVTKVLSGFAGGHKESPSYKEVSRGGTGHIEAVKVIYDSKKVDFSTILDVFWRHIDPTDAGGQFGDRGHTYTTAIFYHNEEQKNIAESSKKELQKKGPFKKPIVTPIIKFKNFYLADESHQDYYRKNFWTAKKYSLYRSASGRNTFIKKHWDNFKDYKNIKRVLKPKRSPRISHDEGSKG